MSFREWGFDNGSGGGGGAVDSVFGRAGNVVALAGDYAASQVTNDSGVAGADVAAALDTLALADTPPVVASVDPSAVSPVAPLFNTFAEAWTYLEGYEGFRVLTLLGDVTVAPGTYSSGRGLRIAGDISRDTTLTVPEGVVFEGLRQITDRVKILFTGTTPPISDFAGVPAPLFQPDICYIEKGSSVDCTGAGPFFRIAGDGSPQSNIGGLAINFTQEIGADSTTPVFEAVAGAFGFIFTLPSASLAPGSLACDAASVVAVQLAVDSNTSRNPADYPGILGGLVTELQARANLVNYDPFLNFTGLISENVQGAIDEVAETGLAFGGYLDISTPLILGVPVLVNPTVQSAGFDPSTYVWAPSTDVSIQRDGKYEITYGAVYFNAGGGTRFILLDLLVNGLAQPGLEVITSVEGSGFTPANGITRTAVVDLVAGDTVGIAATQLNGAATVVTLPNEVFLNIKKVR